MFREEEFRKEVLSYYLTEMVAQESFTLDGEEHRFWWIDIEKGTQAVVSRYTLPEIEEDPVITRARLTLLQAPRDYLDGLVAEVYA